MFQFILSSVVLVVSLTAGVSYINQIDTATRYPDNDPVQRVGVMPDQTVPSTSVASDMIRDHNPSKGPKNAKVVVVKFLDFQCPACGAVYPVEEAISQKYNDKVRFVFKMYPLTAIHKNAQSAAKSALAAVKQGKYFEYTDRLFTNPLDSEIDLAKQEQIASDLKLDMAKWKLDRESQEIENFIQMDIKDGRNAKIPDSENPLKINTVDSTPTFVFIKNGKVQYKTNGMSSDEFTDKLDRLLK